MLLDFLKGAGEMGARMRALDWSATPLGDPASWPQSLRTSVSTCLNSRFPILVWWGRELVMLYNNAYSSITGAKHPQCLGQPGQDVWPEIWDIIGPMLASVLEHGEATWSEKQMLPLVRRGFIEECYFTFSYSPIADETGGVGGVFTAVTEVTGQVLNERRLQLLHELSRSTAAAESVHEACTRAVRSLSADLADVPFSVIYRLTPQGTLALSGSHGVAAGGGLASAECTRQDSVWPIDDLLSAPNASLVVDVSQHHVIGEQWPDVVTHAVIQALTIGGTVFGVLITGASPRLAMDDYYRTFHETIAASLTASISTARSHEEERARLAALAEFDRAKTTFFSNISHEFRTPLSLILTPLEEAASAPSAALAGPDLFAALRNAQRLKRLVNQLLEFARVEAKRVEVRYQPTDVAALTVDLASAFRSAIERSAVRLHVDCPPLAGPFLLDPEMWETIVLNLVSNAFKFTFEGEIGISLREARDHVELRVRDTGIGIAEQHLSKIFDRFHRIEGAKSRSHEGSGIGLALVADLVELHGGKITVRSSAGQGTEFVLTIPRAAGDALNTLVTSSGGQKQIFVDEASRWSPADVGAPTAVQETPPLSKVRILLADDNADMRAYIGRLLGRHWTVIQVSNGAEALASARADPPDLVLADVMMPELDGFGLVRELRADRRLAGIPIILLSARAGQESVAEGLRSGADDYIVKPFAASQLLVRVETQLATTRMRTAAYDERHRLYTALMNAPAAVCLLTGEDCVIELVNQACLTVWGRDETIIGKPLVQALPELVDQPFFGLLQHVRRTGDAYREKSMLCKLDVNHNGTLEDVYFDFVYEPVRDAAGTVGSILVFAVDITHQVRSQRAVEVALDEARHANLAKDEFLAMLGHELRNPMAPILTAVELMKIKNDRDVGRERAIIERQSRQLMRLLDDLLDVSRISRGTVDLKRTRISVAELVTKSIETSAPLFETKRHRLDVDVSPDLQLDADLERMAQVVSNLLTNAAKYTPPGGHIVVRAVRERDDVVLTVRDNGIGIAPEILPLVFEMFVQARQGADRGQGGLGLGLSIVRAIVRRHGGDASARSAGKGEGSEFEVRLPVASEVGAILAAPSGNPGIPRTALARRVLIVDDNVDAASLLAEAVTAMGHETCVVYDAVNALKTAETFRPNIALLDIGLPVMDGYELAMHLRAKSDPARLIAVSGYGQPGDREQSRRAGFEAHMVKPVDLGDLASAIELLSLRCVDPTLNAA